ncbi:unnamed protein product [Phaeothamnion confervicola]
MVQNLQIDIENRRERLLRYHKDHKTVRSLLVQRCKLHALMVLEGMEDKNDAYGALAALGAAVNGHGEAHLMALRKAVFSPVLSNNMDPDSFRAQCTADKQKVASCLWRGGAGAHRALANLVRPGLQVHARQERLLLQPRRAVADRQLVGGDSALRHMVEAKQVTAARRDGGASPAYGAVETADHSFKNPRNHHQSKPAAANATAAELAAAVQPPRPPPAKTRWTRKPPGASGDDDRGSGMAAFGRLGGGGDAGQCGGGSTPHLPFKGQVGVCYHCGGTGHSWRRCTRLLQQQPAQAHAVEERRVGLGAAPPGDGPPRVNVVSHTANVFYAGEAALPSAPLAATLHTVVHAPIPLREFIVNSGAARTFDPDLLILQRVKKISRPVVAAGGEEYTATYSGVLHGIVEETGSGRPLEFSILDAECVPGLLQDQLPVRPPSPPARHQRALQWTEQCFGRRRWRQATMTRRRQRHLQAQVRLHGTAPW